MVPRCHGWRSGKEHAPATGARQHTARPVKDHSTYQRSAATGEGVGARCHHAARQPTPMPRPPGTSVRRMQPHGQSARPRAFLGLSWEERCRVGPLGCAATEQRRVWHQKRRPGESLPQRHLLGCASREAHHVCLSTRLGDRSTHVQANTAAARA